MVAVFSGQNRLIREMHGYGPKRNVRDRCGENYALNRAGVNSAGPLSRISRARVPRSRAAVERGDRSEDDDIDVIGAANQFTECALLYQ
jgi:hypothetical protein